MRKKQICIFISVIFFFFVIGAYSNTSENAPQYLSEKIPKKSGGLVEIGHYYDHDGLAVDLFVSDSLVYVADWLEGLEIINISDPTSLTEVGQLNLEGAYAVYVSGSYAYIAALLEGLKIVNVTDPTTPIEVGDYYDMSGEGEDVFVTGSFAYLADAADGLEVINITDPTSPAEVGQFDDGGHIIGVHVSGSYAYLADYDVGLEIVNITDPTSPLEVGQKSLTGINDVFVSGSFAYAVGDNGVFEIINITDPTNPTTIGSHTDAGDSHGVYVSGSLAFIASSDRGVEVMDISDPTNPVEIFQYDDGGDAVNLVYLDDLVYVADFGDGLEILYYDDILPVIHDPPPDIQFYENETSSINWNIVEEYPDIKEMHIDGVLDPFFNPVWAENITYPLGTLLPGLHNYTLVVTDAGGNTAQDTVWVNVFNINPSITRPPDMEYWDGDTGNILSWFPSDTHPSDYFIYKDSILNDTNSWLSLQPITINVDGLDVGVYNYTIVIFDTTGNSAVDTVFVTVLDSDDPMFLIHPSDIYMYENQSTFIEWNITDRFPGSIILYINGTPDDNFNLTWTETEWQFRFILDNISPGIYNYTLIIFDEIGNYAQDTVIITVFENPTDVIPPFLPPLRDIEMMQGETNMLQWEPYDINPGTYILHLNGDIEVKGSWTTEEGISYDLSELEVGEYLLTLYVYDESGNLITDSVYVSVTEPPKKVPGYNLLIFVGVGGISILILTRNLWNKLKTN